MSQCQRCNKRQTEVQCSNCDIYGSLCRYCDTYVHSLPSRSEHIRESLENNWRLKTPSYSDKVNKCSSFVHKSNINSDNELSNNDDTSHKRRQLTENAASGIKDFYRQHGVISSIPCIKEGLKLEDCSALNRYTLKTLNSEIGNSNTSNPQQTVEPKNPDEVPKEELILSIDEERPYSFVMQTQYSREYIKDLKAAFLKEKNELLFKNMSLQTTLEKLKNVFSDKIIQMTSQIEITNQRHQLSIKTLEEEVDSFYRNILLDKDSEIDDLKKQVKTFSEANKSVSERLNSALIELDDLKLLTQNKEVQLKEKLADKEKEIERLGKEMECKNSSFNIILEAEKKKLKIELESHNCKQLADFESKHNLVREELVSKEDYIKKLKNELDLSQNHNSLEIKQLSEELSSNRHSHLKASERKFEAEKEIQDLRLLVDSLKKESKMQHNEIRLMEANSKIYQKENEQLKQELTKLSKLVYGKSKPQK